MFAQTHSLSGKRKKRSKGFIMHGRKREEYKAKTRDPKTAAILAKKAEQWYILMKELQDRRVLSRKSEEQENDVDTTSDRKTTIVTTLKLLGKALEVNPDPMNLWNHRRETILQEIELEGLSLSFEGNDEDQMTAVTNIIQRERILTQKALEGNPKAYGSWFHRKWILQTFRPSTRILQEELALTKKFLNVDERNFHCWNYRRFLVACMGSNWDGEWTVGAITEPQSKTILMGTQVVNHKDETKEKVIIPTNLIRSEFDFTTEKIQQNFSNFSAFHYRSQLLTLFFSEDNSDENNEALLENEFGLIEDAVCTEPDDQTCWWYHAILLDQLVVERSQSYSLISTLRPRLEEQAELFREILDDSPDSKWVILGLFRVLRILGMDTDIDEGDNNLVDSIEEQEELLQRLIRIDPYRSKRYEELRVKME